MPKPVDGPTFGRPVKTVYINTGEVFTIDVGSFTIDKIDVYTEDGREVANGVVTVRFTTTILTPPGPATTRYYVFQFSSVVGVEREYPLE
jgi:hypothetical protein